jgi:hypothetical protein
MRGIGIQATGRVELLGRIRVSDAGRADRNTNGLMGVAVGMADGVIVNDHDGFSSFKETL